MTPFERFFQFEFQRLLDTIGSRKGLYSVPERDIRDSSWDRKAAYLLWLEMGKRSQPQEEELDIL